MSESTEVADLLKLLGKDSSESEPISTSKIDAFIKQFNLEKGLDRIEPFVIYYLYSEVFGGSISKIGFFRLFRKEFNQKRTGKKRFYMVNLEKLNITREDYIRAEFHNKGKKSTKEK